MATRSYGWKKKLDAPVAPNGTVDIPTPGRDLELTVTVDAFATYGGAQLGDADATQFWAGDGSKVTLTNTSADTWKQGEDVYVFAPGLFAGGDKKVETILMDHETRIAALETP